MALSLYMKGPTAYEAFRKQMSTIQIIMPSVSTLKKLKSNMTPKEGTFPRCYGWYQDEFLSSAGAHVTESDFYGHIMCDEMKLKLDFYWNPATHKCVGIVIDGDLEQQIDLAGEVRKMYADSVFDSNNEEPGASKSNVDSSYSVSLSVNQYRFCSANNHTHTGEFFFNNGSLSGDELLYQVKQVIFGYEMIGVRILGLVSDGGGNNARLFKLLRGGNDPAEGCSWLPEEHMSFPNPADPSRRIAMFHCTTHGLKNLQNALFASYPKKDKATRDFTVDHIHFGWESIVSCFERDKQRPVADTSLKTNGAVYPNKWSKMDVSLAKAPFKFDTLLEQVLYLAEELNCVDDIVQVRWLENDCESNKIMRQIDLLKDVARTRCPPPGE